MIEANDKCSGCKACIQACPQKCISIDENYRAKVDVDSCKQCGLCDRVCQITHNVKSYFPEDIYAAHNKNQDELLQSSSGGIGRLLLTNCLSLGFKVFSAINNLNLEPIIDEIRVEDIPMAIKSKYCFSDTNDTYIKCKNYLDKGFNVIYLALPCQISGLKLFLKKEYDNLFCVDLFCHGAPSPVQLNKQLVYKSNKHRHVIDVQFRDKSVSDWGNYCYLYKFSDGSCSTGPALCDFYFSNFINGRIFRESCYQCQYASFNRVGDMSIGDYWHIKPTSLKSNVNGISAVLINTKNGRRLWHIISQFCEFEVGSKEGVANATHAVVKPINRPSNIIAPMSLSQREYNTTAKYYENSLVNIIRLIRFKLKRL